MTAAVGNRPIDVDALERALREADPAALLVRPRILRRVIKRDLGLARVGLQVPHRHLHVTTAESLHAVATAAELGLARGAEWPSPAILLERPTPEDLDSSTRDAVLGDYWRMLFHARVHLAIDRVLPPGQRSAQAVHARFERIGACEVEEIRSVLRQEGLLLPGADDRTVYGEFAAYYLELRRFAPALLPHTFPGLRDRAAVEALLAEDVDDAALFSATRPEGAADPRLAEVLASDQDDAGDDDDALEAVAEEVPATGASRRLIHRATLTGGRGNVVRAAILWTAAARRADPQLADSVRAGARTELDRLVRRLQHPLGFDEPEADRWRRALPMLLERAARGFWNPEARLLYDLQKVCVDHEREVFTIDLVGFVASWGRLPIRRVRPYLREVMIANHLRSASRRLRSIRLRGDDRTRLAVLVRGAVHRAELAMRDRLRGPIDATLTTTGFRPRNLPERVAYRKLVEELLDRIAGRGFLSIGDLRDACARGNLKLPDLSGPREFLAGDRLLQADRALADSLDGVYRRGEVYLRWLQRFSSLAFATQVGRFLTSYVALPFGGAYILLEGLQHLVEPVFHWSGGHGHLHIRNWTSLLLLGTVALGVVNFPGFRRTFVTAVGTIGRALRMVLFDWLRWVLRQPIVRLLFAGRFASLVWRLALKPALLTVPAWLLLRMLGLSDRLLTIFTAGVFLEIAVVVNSRIGRDVEEILADEAVRTWKQLYRDLVPGVYRLIMGWFDAVLEMVDRFLYAVDEWLRFRTGQSRALIASKALLGAFWFFLAYLVRIYVNLLIEPQVNPIKHFPVVTVSHKIMLPFLPMVTRVLAAPLMPLGRYAANSIAVTTAFLLPGLFGFLVWEFKENWRLYEANRKPALGPVTVGSHGETIGRLLRPGFHSGTLPKLFAKLRKGERRWLREGREKAVIRHREALHHVEEAIAQFVEREFLALVHESRPLRPLAIELAGLEVSTNLIRFELKPAGDDGEGLGIAFEQRPSGLVATVSDAAWLSALDRPGARTLATAVAGLYKLSGVDWVRDEPHPGDRHRHPHPASLTSFKRVTITWRSWVEAWERDVAGKPHEPEFLDGPAILPQVAGLDDGQTSRR